MSDGSDQSASDTQIAGTLQLGPTAPAPTETIRPDERRPQHDTPFDVGDLPSLTRDEDDQAAMAEIEVRELLGRGGMGEVRLARQLPLGRDVAVKSVGGVGRESQVDEKVSLLRESWVTGRLEHPNIVPIHTLGRNAAGEPMLVMKKIGGISWAELLRHPERSPRDFDSDNPLDWHLEILSRVCDAVHFAHSKGIIHRDIKPENVMIGEFGEVYLLDWGIAVSLQEDPEGRLPTVSEITSPAGTPVYMAPEMVGGDPQKLCRQTDIFLLGAVLHEVVTGLPPNDGETLEDIMWDAYRTEEFDYQSADVHPELAEICQKAMRQDPEERYATADKLRQAIAHHMNHRESIQMSREAEQRLDELTEVLEDEDASEARVYQIFGECRFGFEQALRVSPDNDAALRGLQAALERMAERELERGAYQAASLLVADLPEPNATLERRLEELEEKLASREQEFEKLKEMRREEDVDVARDSRAIFAIMLGVIWGAVSVAFPRFAQWIGHASTSELYLAYSAPVGLVIGGLAYIKRDAVLSNRANRRFGTALTLIVFSGVLVRTAGTFMELPVSRTIAMELLVYGCGGAVMGATLDARIFAGVGPYLLAGLMVALLPQHAFLLFALACVVSMSALGWIWWPRTADD